MRALDVSVEEQDSFGSFGEDSVQTLLSLALADPERAKERFPAYRLTRLVERTVRGSVTAVGGKRS
jgi:hypothetical protein